MPEKLKIALVGCGDHMYKHFYDYTRDLPLEVVAICDIDPEKLARFRARFTVPSAYTDYHEMLRREKLDAVICIVNAQVHYEVAKACLEAGVPALVEKTPCETAEQAREIARLQQQTGLQVMVGFNRRFATGYAMAKEISTRPEFGGTTMYFSKFNSSPYRSEEYFVFNHLIHHLDLARFFLGELKDLSVRRIALSDVKVGYHLIFRAESGAIGMIQSGSLQHEEYPMERLEVTGDCSNVIVDNIKRLEYNRPGNNKEVTDGVKMSADGDALVWNLNHGFSTEYSHIGYERELAYFTDCLLNKKVPTPNFEDAVKTMELYEQVKRLTKESK